MVDIYLKTSVQQYRRILEHAEQLAGLLSHGDPEKLQEYTTRLNELQAEAGLFDGELLAEIVQNPQLWRAHPLFQERLQLLTQIVAINDFHLPQINGMKAMAAADLDQLRDGRVAASGYATTFKKDHRVSRSVS
jgi:hypothetical protein